MSLRIYVCSAYPTAPLVRHIHTIIRELGHRPVSTWAETATGAESLEQMSDAEALAAWRTNHDAVRACDVAFVLADTGGRETFAEAHTAFAAGKLVVWIGPETLTARVHRTQTVRVESVEDALTWLARVPGTAPRVA